MSNRLLLMVAALEFAFPAMAHSQPALNRGMKLDANGAVRIYNLAGSVTVHGWNRDSVAVRGSVGKGNVFHMGGDHSGMKMFVEDADERNPSPGQPRSMAPDEDEIMDQDRHGRRECEWSERKPRHLCCKRQCQRDWKSDRRERRGD